MEEINAENEKILNYVRKRLLMTPQQLSAKDKIVSELKKMGVSDDQLLDKNQIAKRLGLWIEEV